MSELAEQLEHSWLRAYLEHYDEVSFTPLAERQMNNSSVHLSDVLHVFRCGDFIHSERDYDGSIATISGRNCDEKEIEIEVRIVSETMSVTVEKVRKTRRERTAK